MQTNVGTDIDLKIPDDWNNELKPIGIKIKFKKDCEYSKLFGIENVELIATDGVVLFALNDDITDDGTAYDDITELIESTNIVNELFSALKVYLENSENKYGDRALATICTNIAVIKLVVLEEENPMSIAHNFIVDKSDILCLKYLETNDVKKYEVVYD